MIRKHKETIAFLISPDDILPVDALHKAIKHYDEIKPALYAAIKYTPADIESLDAQCDDNYLLQIFAMYLAAEKRDADAFPLIRDFFAQYGEAADEVTGDLCCEDLDRILASVCQDGEALKSAAELPGLSSWPRIAFFAAIGILFHQGYLERARLVRWFQGWLMQDDFDLICRTSIAFICCDLGIYELETLLLEMLHHGRIAPNCMRSEYLNERLHNDQLEIYKQDNYVLVDNASDLLQNSWYEKGDSRLYARLFEPEESAVILKLLDDYEEELTDPLCELEFVHGYVQAVVLRPEASRTDEWIAGLFSFCEIPDFCPIVETNTTLEVLMKFYDRLNQLRLDDMLHCPFRPEDGRYGWWLNSMLEWCRGFFHGMQWYSDLWISPDLDPVSEEYKYAFITLLTATNEPAPTNPFDTLDTFDTNGTVDRSEEGRQFLACDLGVARCHSNINRVCASTGFPENHEPAASE